MTGTPTLAVRVSCHSGHRGEQEPLHFAFADRVIAVAEILDRWLAPDHRYFKVKGDDGATYILRHDAEAGIWELTLYRRAK